MGVKFGVQDMSEIIYQFHSKFLLQIFRNLGSKMRCKIPTGRYISFLKGQHFRTVDIILNLVFLCRF